MAGYSKRSLVDKLGIKPGHRIYLGNKPDRFEDLLAPLPEGIVIQQTIKGPCDFIQFFVLKKSELLTAFPKLKKNLAVDGCLWISWPKGASKIKTDVNENVVRDIGLANGLVDVKVCAVDDIWSGLKFVFRLKDRAL
jgi:hypothetical protein